MRIVDVRLRRNDADATTIGEYLIKLLQTMWTENESFSSKRPFGNSDWKYELYQPLVAAKLVEGTLDEYEDIVEFDQHEADRLIFNVIGSLYIAPKV